MNRTVCMRAFACKCVRVCQWVLVWVVWVWVYVCGQRRCGKWRNATAAQRVLSLRRRRVRQRRTDLTRFNSSSVIGVFKLAGKNGRDASSRATSRVTDDEAAAPCCCPEASLAARDVSSLPNKFIISTSSTSSPSLLLLAPSPAPLSLLASFARRRAVVAAAARAATPKPPTPPGAVTAVGGGVAANSCSRARSARSAVASARGR
jgi:hypothetical protein